MKTKYHLKLLHVDKRYYLILIIYFFLLYPVKSQDTIYAYKVTGKDSFRNSGHWQKMKEGEMLLENTWIKIEMNGEVTLFKRNGFKSIKGKYITQIKDIHFEKNEAIWSRLCGGLYNIFNLKPKEGATVITKGEDYQMLFPADGEFIIKKRVNFLWKNNTESRHYFLLTEFPYKDTILYKNDSIRTNKMTLPDIHICPGLTLFDESKSYIWSITSPGKTESNFIHFSFAGQETIESLFKDLGTLHGSQKKIDKEVYCLLEAACYVNYFLYSEANTIFELALKTYPDSVLIREAYDKFLRKVEDLND